MKKQISYEKANAFVIYYPDIGRFWYRDRVDRKWFKNDKVCKMWHKRFAGKEAFLSPFPSGHLRGCIDSESYHAGRIAWLLGYKKPPKYEIDHKNKNPNDNRLSNLRDVPHAINLRNRHKSKNNTSGETAIYPTRSGKKWTVRISHKEKTYNKTLETLPIAILWRDMMRAEIGGYTEHHGY